MKSAFLIPFAALLLVSSPSSKATNLLNPKGWITVSGSVTTGSNFLNLGYNAQFAIGNAEQTIATVPGTTYILQYQVKTVSATASYLDVTVSGTSTLFTFYPYDGTLPNTFSAQAVAFTANSAATTLDFTSGSANLENLSVTAGSFTKPGKYTGTVMFTQSLPTANISGSHTDTVITRVTASGGISILTEPFADITEAVFWAMARSLLNRRPRPRLSAATR